MFWEVITCLIIFYSIFIYKKWKFIKFSWKVNGFWFPILPIFGNSYICLFSGGVNLIAFVQWIERFSAFPFNFWFSHMYTYVTVDITEIKKILNHPKCLDKAAIYNQFKFCLGDSILMVPGEIWKHQRKYYNTAFKSSILKSNVSSFYWHSNKLIEEFNANPKMHDLFDYLATYSLTNFFVSNAGLNNEDSALDVKRMNEIISGAHDLIKSLIVSPFIIPKIWLQFFPAGRKFNKLLNEGKVLFGKGFEHKMRIAYDVKEYIDNGDRCLVDLIISETSKIDNYNIFQQTVMFLSAASDTSGATLTFCFVLLGMHPEIQEVLFQEVANVLGDNEITYQDLPNLKYTEAVIRETLRLFPPVPIVGRLCEDDIDLGSKKLPKGSSCLINFFHVHRNPEYWPDPLKFDPSRFFPENQAKINPAAYLPFSAGPRDCIGKAQAMVLVKVTLANVIRSLRISSKERSIDEFSLTSGLSMRASNSLDCRFSPRN